MDELSVVDTVVLRHFLFADSAGLLMALLGRPMHVPRVVFDPEEGPVLEAAMSELTRSILVQTRTARDVTRPSEATRVASLKAKKLGEAHTLHERGDLVVVDLTQEETVLFAALTTREGARDLGLSFPIHAGEAACIAVGLGRGWVVATDDGDALKALEVLKPGHPYERCRKLLVRAAEEGLVTRIDANRLHGEMSRLGFRDKERPFPDEGGTEVDP